MKAKRRIFFKIIAIIILSVFVLFAGIMIYINSKIAYYSRSIDFNRDQLMVAYAKPEVFDVDNNSLQFSQSNSVISIDELHPYTKQAFIAIEDKSFYQHNGFNYKRMAKALFNNLKSGHIKEGASTISQQLIKNALLSNEKTIERKLKEVALTQKLEKNFSKDEILEIYLNTIYFGNNNFGIENASLTYFGKSATDLNVDESAILASIIKLPTFYSNEENSDQLLRRKNLVLNEMFKEGYISQDTLNNALANNAVINYDNSYKFNSAYQQGMLNEASSLLNLSQGQLFNGKYKIFTYYDNEKQDNITTNIEKQVSDINAETGAILIENNTRGISALASTLPNFGSLSRQSGSVVKPILVYAPALELGKITIKSPILDEKIDYSGYSPNNATNKFYGYVSVEDSVKNSLNIPAVKVLDYVGIEQAKAIACKMGLEFSASDNHLAMALGSSLNGNNMIDLAGAYTSLANLGKYEKPHFIREIQDQNGNVVYKYNPSIMQAIRSDTAYLTTKMLTNVAQKGTAKRLGDLPFEVASKTGTVGVGMLGKNSDAYNLSMTSQHTLGVWIGSKNNENQNLLNSNINGSTLPTDCAKSILQTLYSQNKPNKFEKPDSVKTIEIDSLELEQNHKIVLANENTPDRYKISMEASELNTPIEKSTNFLMPMIPSFSVDVDKLNNNVKLQFDAKNIEQYEIYKNNSLLKTIAGKNGQLEIIDNDIKPNKTYSYQIKVKQTGANGIIESELSPSKEIFVVQTQRKASSDELEKINNAYESIFSKK